MKRATLGTIVSAIGSSSRAYRLLQSGAVCLVAEAHLTRLDLTGADTGERGERPARVGLDPYVDHRYGFEHYDQSR